MIHNISPLFSKLQIKSQENCQFMYHREKSAPPILLFIISQQIDDSVMNLRILSSWANFQTFIIPCNGGLLLI